MSIKIEVIVEGRKRKITAHAEGVEDWSANFIKGDRALSQEEYDSIPEEDKDRILDALNEELHHQ